ncbi:MAG: hypothetical protein EA361_14075 [Bacteroidetes bacterium]|nr:MAG: hypothetical protein EA361_14075 [Bacteroidota bacterium]
MQKLLIVVGLALVIVSCAKNEESDPIPHLTFMPLEIGNYWVYENRNVAQDGTITPVGKLDSIVVARDTILGGEKYFVLEGIQYGSANEWRIISILRDSLSYLVDEKGDILFAENHFGEVLRKHYEIHNNDTLAIAESMMQKVPVSVAVPGGNFDALNYGTTVTSFLTNPEGDAFLLDNLYAKDVGRVLHSSIYLGSQTRLEKRLVRYHLE